ncbi:protealysin inhibitor emfourin [Halomonas sp. WWR20]
MSASLPPPLTASSVIAVSREGGLAHFPGLAAPRRIPCAQCSDDQRRRLHELLSQAAQRGEHDEPACGADRRAFRLAVEEDAQPRWTVVIDEEKTPGELVALWKRGGM